MEVFRQLFSDRTLANTVRDAEHPHGQAPGLDGQARRGCSAVRNSRRLQVQVRRALRGARSRAFRTTRRPFGAKLGRQDIAGHDRRRSANRQDSDLRPPRFRRAMPGAGDRLHMQVRRRGGIRIRSGAGCAERPAAAAPPEKKRSPPKYMLMYPAKALVLAVHGGPGGSGARRAASGRAARRRRPRAGFPQARGKDRGRAGLSRNPLRSRGS